jgi:hypothetical protein
MRFDIVAVDEQGWDVLLVDVKAKVHTDRIARAILQSLRDADTPARFGMVADLQRIRIADFDRIGVDFVCVLDTAEMLREYDPEFGQKRIFSHYLTTLVDAWLRDVAFHWKSETPPGLDRLKGIGLAQRLEDGDTRREVLVGPDPLR